MSARTLLVVTLLLAAGAAHGACKDHSRDLSFIELAVPEGAPRPADVNAFAFIGDDTTVKMVEEKVGPPNASAGSNPPRLIWCLPDGTEVTIATSDGSTIVNVRHDGKVIYKRAKKKK